MAEQNLTAAVPRRLADLWPVCVHCGHRVNPRSEVCEVDHTACSPQGCEVEHAQVGEAFAAGPMKAVPTTGTLYMLDIASYQAGINLSVCKQAGFDAVNIKTSQGNWYQFKDAPTYARNAAALGMGVSAFHWIDNSSDGTTQANYCWQILSQIITAAGHPVALQVDCEDTSKPASYTILRDFITRMTQLMGHQPYVYTGDWWATSGGRASWNVAALSPWLMAAPNNGYLGSYPGDNSSEWAANYWGFPELSLMQYAVSPIANAGGGSISKTAIRNPLVWEALTGGFDMSQLDDIWKALNEVRAILRMVHWRWDPDAQTWTDHGGEQLFPGVYGEIGGGSFVSGINQMIADISAVKTNDVAQTAAIQALSDLLGKALSGAGTGSATIDTAAVVSAVSGKIDAATQAESDAVKALQDTNARLVAQVTDLTNRLAAAGGALTGAAKAAEAPASAEDPEAAAEPEAAPRPRMRKPRSTSPTTSA